MFSIRNKGELIGDLRGILHLLISKGLTQENIRVCKTRLYSILIIPLFVRELRIFCAQTHPYCNPTEACCQIFLCAALLPRVFLCSMKNSLQMVQRTVFHLLSMELGCGEMMSALKQTPHPKLTHRGAIWRCIPPIGTVAHERS